LLAVDRQDLAIFANHPLHLPVKRLFLEKRIKTGGKQQATPTKIIEQEKNQLTKG